ncbi:hypothetical protein DFR50_13325 [Roseiarcus fermentans]|uniref:Uncharacterized protein n=1 Tax=Roseiarcus fermentans TaxID=1473586 RepID=A0A366EVM7_9HYPH|nr:hypothetical protein [Roseiarcus fermentans]RBP05760.1 hypothetical protein DFR50_13325 [Roseiarcus fermentans]
MPDWKVFYRDQLDQDRTSGSISSKEAALTRAKHLRRQRAEVYKIEGPDGLTLPKVEIARWMSDNRY